MGFPLPLTPFEHYMLRDGTASHPMEFFFRLSFDGPLDRAAMATATDVAFHRHPLLAARIDDAPGRGPRFVADRPPPPVLPFAAQDDLDLPAIPALDTAAGPLARLFVVERPDGAHDILAQFHHVACDGLGALAFLADWCTALDAALRGTHPASDPDHAPEPALLRHRGRLGLDGWKLLAMLPAQARGLEGIWKFARHRPVGLAPTNGHSESDGRHHVQRASTHFSAAEARALRRAATTAGVSLNELASAALLEALLDTVAAAMPRRPRDVIRLSIPMNMRRPADRRLPAANVVSMVFLDRTAAEIEASGLATSLHAEMQLIKRLGLGMTFLFTLAAARGLPGGIARLVGDRTTAATALFTNLGRIFGRATERGTGQLRVGPRRLVAVEPLAPLRRGTPVGVAALEYGGRLSFTLRTDPAALDLARTETLRDAFAQRLRRHLSSDPVGGPAVAPADVAEACA